MSLKASEQIALDAIEHYLRTADPELTIAFESFATVTANMALPESEQLGASQMPAVKPDNPVAERTKVTFTMWLAILFLVGMVLAGTVLALFSGGRQSGCTGATGPGLSQARAANGLAHGRYAQSCAGSSRGRLGRAGGIADRAASLTGLGQRVRWLWRTASQAPAGSRGLQPSPRPTAGW
jgi:hypothetical protein